MKHCVNIETGDDESEAKCKLNLFVSYNLKLYKLKGSIKKILQSIFWKEGGEGWVANYFLYGGGGLDGG